MRIPYEYSIKSRFPLRGRRLVILHIIGVLTTVILLLAFTNATKTIHADFDLMNFLAKFDSRAMLSILAMALLSFAFMHTYVHEKTHQICFRIFGVPAELHMDLLVPNVTVPTGDGCPRAKAIVATLGPLVVLEVLGLIAWLIIANDFLTLIVFFLSVNVGLATGDVAESVWLSRFPNSYIFGFEGKDSVVYGP